MGDENDLPSWASESGGADLPSWAEGGVDLGAPELHHETGARQLVLPETTIAAGGPTTVAPGGAVEERDAAPAVDALPEGFRTTGRRMTVLPETTIAASVDRRGRVQSGPTTVAPESTGYVAMEAVPGKVQPPRPPPPPPEPTLREMLERRALGRQLTADDAARFAIGGAPAIARGLDLPAFGAGVVDAAQLGFADEGRAALDAVADTLAGRETDYRGDRDRYRAELRAHEERAPGSFAAGGVAGSAPLMLAPGGQATTLGRVAAAGGAGVLTGALRGAGTSEADRVIDAYDRPSLARDTLAGGAIEGLASAGTAGVGEGIVGPAVNRVSRWLARQGDDAARGAVQSRLEASGVWGNRAMRAADEMPGGPEALAADMQRLGIGHGVGDASRIMDARAAGEPLSRARLPRQTRTPDDAAQVMSDAGERMRAVLDRMDEAAEGRNAALLTGTREQAMRGMVDLGRVADEMDAVAREYERLPVGGQQVADALRSQIIEPMRAHGVVRFSDAHRQRRHLDSMIRGWSQDPNLSTVAGRLQTARRELSGAMDDAAGQLSPELQAQWRQANRDYSVGAFADEHGQGASRLSVGGGMGGAVGTGVELAMAGNPLTAIPGALASRAVAQEQRMLYPGLRTVTLETLAPRLRRLGARGQQWAQTLDGARQRGSTSLAAAHLMLQRRDPEYRRAIEEMEEAGETGEE